MTNDALTNTDKHATSTILCAPSHRISILISPNDNAVRCGPAFCGQNVISDGPRNGLSIRQFLLTKRRHGQTKNAQHSMCVSLCNMSMLSHIYWLSSVNNFIQTWKTQTNLNDRCILVFYVLCAVMFVGFCTGHFVGVPLNLTCLYCLQHSVFQQLFNLYYPFVYSSLCSCHQVSITEKIVCLY